MAEPRLNSFYDRPEHLAFRMTVRRFVAREIAAHVRYWDDAECFPRGLYRRAAEEGLHGLRFVEGYGGAEAIMKDLAARQLGQ
jgi:acyl-CoA dehydrogenase